MIELDKTVIAVQLTTNFKLCTFVNEKMLDKVISEEGPFKLKGSGICCCFDLPLPCRWLDFPLAVGRDVARSLSEVVQKMRSDWLQEMRENPQKSIFGKETKTLKAMELEVESTTAESDAIAQTANETVLMVALLPDGTVQREIREDKARCMLEGRLISLASLFGCCCHPGGDCEPDCEKCGISERAGRLVAMYLSGKAQQHWDC